MKLKGINPLEQHVEKIVLGLFVVAALVMVALQFLTPSTVKVQSKELPLDAAYQQTLDEAARLQGRLRSSDLPQGIPEEVPDLAANLRSAVAKPVAPEEPLVVPLGFVAPPRDGGVVGPELSDAEYARIVPPAPTSPIARSYAGALDPLVVEATPELREVVPAEQPYDVRAVSVEATFPASELVRWLDSDPDGAGPQQAYPKFMWVNRLAALDVQLERQERLPNGTYSEAKAVPAVPGLQTVRADLSTENMTVPVYRSIVARAREQERQAIVRPAFLPTIAGQPWLPPSAQPVVAAPAGGQPADLGEIDRLRGILEGKQRELEDVEDALNSQAAPNTQGNRTRGQGIGPGGGGGGQRQDRGPSAEEQRREALQRRSDRLKSEIAEIKSRLDALGGGPAAPQGEGAAILEQAPPALDSGEDFAIWAHDLTAEPGATYRYRIRLVVSNPLFGDRNRPDEPASLEGEYSEWTEPVTVAPETMVFFTSATVGIQGQTGLQAADASAELYTFFYGYWRKASVRLALGDAIAASVDLPSMPLFNVVDGAASESGRTPDEIRVETDGFMVDVVETSGEAGFGQRKSVLQVVYRDAEGNLVSRLPEADRASVERLRAEAAASAGLAGEIRTPGTTQSSAQPQGVRRQAAQPAPGAQQPPQQPAAPSGGRPGRVN